MSIVLRFESTHRQNKTSFDPAAVGVNADQHTLASSLEPDATR